jgi:NADH-ubiquinone oxidoreductase chain 5
VFIEGFVLSILAVASIFIGYVSRDYFVGLGSDFFSSTIYIDPLRNTLVDSEFLPVIYKLLPVVLSLLSILLAY